MSITDRLSRTPDEWNHPRRARYGPPVLAGLGGAAGSILGQSTAISPAISAGLLAGLGGTVGWLGFAAVD